MLVDDLKPPYFKFQTSKDTRLNLLLGSQNSQPGLICALMIAVFFCFMCFQSEFASKPN